MAILKTFNKLLLAMYRWYLPEICLFLIGASLYLYNSFRFLLPTGYAGLYTLMTEQLGANAFKLPWLVPYYGPGGIPYAFPPAGFYLAAFFIKVLNIPVFTYLRFAPAFLTLLFLGLYYLMIRYLTGSRIKALFGAFLITFASAIYEDHVQAAGMVRSLALVLAFTTLILSWNVLIKTHSTTSTILRASLAGLALGLTIMSHLSYALFAILGIAVFALFTIKHNWRSHILKLASIIGFGALFSIIWWGTILSRFGLTVLTNPARSHGNFEVVHAIEVVGIRTAPVLFVQKLIGVTYDWTPAVLIGLIVGGVIYLILIRRWMLPVLFVLTFLIIGEPDRFLLIIGCIAAAELIESVLSMVHTKDVADNRVNFLLYVISAVALLIVPFYSAAKVMHSDQPTLSNEVLEMSSWIRNNTPSDVNYLLLDGNNDLDEWIPYLTHRTPIVGSWGGEWIGNLASMQDLSNHLNVCLSDQSYQCLQELIAQKGPRIPWIISLSANSSLNAKITADPAWQIAFQNNEFIVFKPR